jgi:seryl-tRNA synthetase
VIDPRLLLADPEFVADRLRRRGVDPGIVGEVHHMLLRRRGLRAQADEARAELRRRSAAVGALVRAGDPAQALRAEVATVKERIAALETAERQEADEARTRLLALPNLPDDRVPGPAAEGRDDDAGVVVKVADPGGMLRRDSRPHWETAAALNLADPARAARMSGSGFSVLRGDGARLLRALLAFGLDLHRDRYEELVLPQLVREELMTGSGHLPKFAQGAYRLAEDDLWAVPTAEVPLVGFRREETLDPAELPLRYMTQTTCFRREAGAAGTETRGMQRLHEYHQVELLRVERPDTADQAFEDLTADVERTPRELGLAYRLVEVRARDLPFAARRARRLDVYAPGIRRWLGVSTVSAFGEFQARRSGLRTTADAGTAFVHTLNASAMAASRLWGVLLETGLRPDGAVDVPPALHGHLGRQVLAVPR